MNEDPYTISGKNVLVVVVSLSIIIV